MEISGVIAAAKNATDASNYAEALVMDVEVKSGTDYTVVWSNAYNGTYPPTEE